jgi:hypothetical protein
MLDPIEPQLPGKSKNGEIRLRPKRLSQAAEVAYVSKASRLTPLQRRAVKSNPGRLAYVSKASRLTPLQRRRHKGKPGRLAYAARKRRPRNLFHRSYSFACSTPLKRRARASRATISSSPAQVIRDRRHRSSAQTSRFKMPIGCSMRQQDLSAPSPCDAYRGKISSSRISKGLTSPILLKRSMAVISSCAGFIACFFGD